MTTTRRTPTYALGYSDLETRRLMLQGQFLAELTEDVLHRAGIAEGMRVLDVGCGAGDVSLLLASLVGPTGSVVGIDRAASTIEFARARAAEAGLDNVTFRVGNVAELSCDEQFDAVAGRLVLLYLADPVAALVRFRECVRPGGILVFQEMDMPAMRCVPMVPLVERALGYIIETFRRAGVATDLGARLPTVFRRAGLPAEQGLMHARVKDGPESPAYEYLAITLRSLLPMAERLGVVSAADVDIDTLADRFRDVAVSEEAVLIPPPMIGVWARNPLEA